MLLSGEITAEFLSKDMFSFPQDLCRLSRAYTCGAVHEGVLDLHGGARAARDRLSLSLSLSLSLDIIHTYIYIYIIIYMICVVLYCIVI